MPQTQSIPCMSQSPMQSFGHMQRRANPARFKSKSKSGQTFKSKSKSKSALPKKPKSKSKSKSAPCKNDQIQIQIQIRGFKSKSTNPDLKIDTLPKDIWTKVSSQNFWVKCREVHQVYHCYALVKRDCLALWRPHLKIIFLFSFIFLNIKQINWMKDRYGKDNRLGTVVLFKFANTKVCEFTHLDKFAST